MALTRTTQQEEEFAMPLPHGEAFASVLTAYNKIGKVQSSQEKFGRIVGKIGSGVWNMNSADVTVHVSPDGDSQSKVKFIATAQEGLISQNTGAKAISRLLDAI
tara:strand:- start:142 stop:453 length:312 start_codon:yes stop_codon:yes gene_type:complete